MLYSRADHYFRGQPLLCLPGLQRVIVVEHEMRVVAGSHWVIDIGTGAGDEGGRIVIAGSPADAARAKGRTAPDLARFLGETVNG